MGLAWRWDAAGTTVHVDWGLERAGSEAFQMTEYSVTPQDTAMDRGCGWGGDCADETKPSEASSRTRALLFGASSWSEFS